MKTNLKIVLIRPRAQHNWECLAAGYLASYSYAHGFTPEQYRFFSGEFDDDDTIVRGCQNADIIGFTLTSFQVAEALRLLAIIRPVAPNARIVWGGYAASGLTPAQLLCEYGDKVDCFVQGPGEISWIDVLQSSAAPRVIRNELPDDLNTIPFPDRELIRVDRHFAKLEKLGEKRMTSMEMQRGGCPFGCVFCAGGSLTRKRGLSRKAENIVDEMKLLRDSYGMDKHSMVQMADPEVLLIPELKHVARLRKEHEVDFPFGMNVLASDVCSTNGEAILADLVSAGLAEVWMGVECGPSLMPETGKPNTPDDVRNAFRITRRLGLLRRAYFLLGFTPNENEATIRERISFIEEIDPDIVSFSICIPVPGSPLYDHEKHRLIDYANSCEYYNSYTKTDTLSNEELQEWQKKLESHFSDKLASRNQAQHKNA